MVQGVLCVHIPKLVLEKLFLDLPPHCVPPHCQKAESELACGDLIKSSLEHSLLDAQIPPYPHLGER